MTKGTHSPRPRSESEAAPEDAPAIVSPKKAATTTTKTKAASSAGSSKGANLQDLFLNFLRREKLPVTMFLVKGVKLQGIVTWFDNFSILLRRDGQSQLVYKHAISTIMPGSPMDISEFATSDDDGKKHRQLQDIFLSRVAEAEVHVTMFLVNGVMLQGRIAAFDQFSMLLEREGYVQMAYKHAVSTVQPATPVDLTTDFDEND